MRRLAVTIALVVGIMWSATTAQAGPIYTYEASSGGISVAKAEFQIVEGYLQITLTNTSTNDVLAPADVLTAFFFDLAGVNPLTPVSAFVNDGSTVLFEPTGATNVGGEWAYKSGLSAPYGATEGISSAGFGIFGGPNFNGPNLEDPMALNGISYGLTSAGDNTLTGNNQVTGDHDLVKNSIVFKFGYVGNIDLSTALDPLKMSFQYGTQLSEPNLKVPEPSSLFLLTLALGALGTQRKRLKVA